jgi:putative transposase
MRTARAKVDGAGYYHVMNRVLERRFILKDEVAEHFRVLMRKVEAFTGVEVVTYCIMTNHVHLLLRVPHRKQLSDKELMERMRGISSGPVFAAFQVRWNRMIEQKSDSGLDELRQSVRSRMFDLSAFMKELKQRFSIWYNRRAKRQGTLWEDRFKSTLIQEKPGYLTTAAAYIDNNPVRAGLVQDAKDFRHCGYAEALAGGVAALRGLGRLAEAMGFPEDAESALRRHRQLLAGKSASPDQAVHSHGADLSFAERAAHRLRWLSDGAVIGSRAFVQDMRDALREKLGLKRARGAYPVHAGYDICSLRSLRSD